MLPKKILILLTFFIIFLSSIVKVYSIEPDIFVQSTVNRAAKTLGGNLTKGERIEELKKIAKDTVDINGIGNYTLGSYRKTISAAQIEQYKILFEKYFLKSFASRLAEYSNPEIEVTSKKKLSENYTMVSSILAGTEQRPEIKIDWRIITSVTNEPLIIDLVIEGISIAKVQREEFNSIIQSNNGSIDALFENLREFVSK